MLPWEDCYLKRASSPVIFISVTVVSQLLSGYALLCCWQDQSFHLVSKCAKTVLYNSCDHKKKKKVICMWESPVTDYFSFHLKEMISQQ